MAVHTSWPSDLVDFKEFTRDEFRSECMKIIIAEVWKQLRMENGQDLPNEILCWGYPKRAIL